MTPAPMHNQMALDAFVHCACYRQGKTAPFPLPRWRDHFRLTPDGTLGLDLPYDGYALEHDTVQTWMQSACSHEDMELVSEHLGNQMGYLAFLQGLAQLGWKAFPTLQQELLQQETGYTIAPRALLMLRELTIFSKNIHQAQNAFLVNTLSDNAIQGYLVATQGIFVVYAKARQRMGIDPGGFFIQRQSTTQPDSWDEVFRAMQFEQRVFKRDATGKPLHVEFYCAETEARFATDIPLVQYESMGSGALVMPHYPTAMHVERRYLDSHYFRFILHPLKRLCQASIRTGNPIVWA